MAKHKRRQQPFSRKPSPASISEQLELSNVWSDWLVDRKVGPTSWARLAALLLRNLKPRDVAIAIGPVIVAERDAIAKFIIRNAKDRYISAEYDAALSHDFYRTVFLNSFEERLSAAVGKLQGDADIEWFAKHVQAEEPYAGNLLRFLLNGIAQAIICGDLKSEDIPEDIRFLTEIEWQHPYILDSVEVLTRHFFTELREQCTFLSPLPGMSVARGYDRSDILPDSSLEAFLDDVRMQERRRIEHTRAINRASIRETDVPDDAFWRNDRVNDWHRALLIDGVDPLGWELFAAFLLRDVPLDSFAKRLPQAINELDAATTRAVNDDWAKLKGRGRRLPYELWLAHLLRQLQQCDNSIITLVTSMCSAPDARYLADLTPALDGVVFFDFLLRCVDGHQQLQAQDREGRGGRYEAASKDRYALKIRPIDKLASTLHARFCEAATYGVHQTPQGAELMIDTTRPMKRSAFLGN